MMLALTNSSDRNDGQPWWILSASCGTGPQLLTRRQQCCVLQGGNAPIHPFYVSDVGYKQTSTAKINLSGDGSETNGITGTQNFTLSFNDFDPANDVLYFFCTAHSSMLDQFSFAASLPLVGTSDLFEDTTNATWIRVLPTTIKAEDLEDSQLQQTVTINFGLISKRRDFEFRNSSQLTALCTSMGMKKYLL